MTSAPRRFVLVPGFWLGAWAWEQVSARLVAGGHEVRAVTLPGLEAADAQRAAVTLDDHVAAVVEALQEPSERSTVLVGHSGAGAVIYGATDRVPQLVHHAVYGARCPTVPSAPPTSTPRWWSWHCPRGPIWSQAGRALPG